MNRTRWVWAAAVAVLWSTLAWAAGEGAGGQAAAPAVSDRLERKGVVVDFEARPVQGSGGLREGQLAEIRFKLSQSASGEPIRGITPGVWMDMAQVIQGQPGSEQKTCKDKIALYLKGVVGIRPMLDLNSYYILVLNQGASISVVDPLVSMVGVTSTFATVPISGPGMDWTKSADDKRVYVSVPSKDEVAVMDTDAFKITGYVPAGDAPTRVRLQPDGRFLWVGNNARDGAASGVTVIDTERLEALGSIATGAGHHEIAFTADSRYAFVSNRDAGTVSVIDVARREKLEDIPTGPVPIALGYSPAARALYVADGQAGTLTVVSGESLDVIATIALAPGLGPLRLTEDGRLVFTVNPSENKVYVVDTATNRVVNEVEVAGRPFQIMLTRAFAYVRALDSKQVSLIALETVGEGQTPIVNHFDAGNTAPGQVRDLVLADTMASASTDAASLIVNPADNTTYFYMEGMNAPSSNYKTMGSAARAVTVVDRSLKEIEPGVFTSRVKLPAPGKYDVAFVLDTPSIFHCFSADVAADPTLVADRGVLAVDYAGVPRTTPAGSPTRFRFKLTRPATGVPVEGVKDVTVLFFRVPGKDRTTVTAREIGGGVYEAELTLRKAGAYYVHVGVPSQNVGFNALPYFSMAATRGAPRPPAQAANDGRG